MEIVVTHDMADFDALASAVAAQKLNPAARIVLGRQIGREVRTFLALHKDRFPSIRVTSLDQSAVTRMIVVDVRRRSRLEGLSDVLARADRGQVDVHIYDHHPAADDDLHGSVEVVQPVGSATTLLVERIRARSIAVDRLEATLWALGIHADTGSLTYAGTTARDARVLAWLIGHGADSRMIARYLRPPFTSAQRRALRGLLDAVEVPTLGGLPVGLALVKLPRVVDGVAEVTTEAADLIGCAALFVVFAFGTKNERVQVVARSRSAAIDAGKIVLALGGGGHATAASAAIKDRGSHETLAAISAALTRDPPRPKRVRELMSSPVHSVAPGTSLAELADCLQAWRHTGAPVLEDGQLVGIISHRDFERAAQARMDLPVASCMTRRLVTTTADASLEEALALTEQHDIGRLPVLRDGKLVGILTRADLLRVLYAESGAE